MRKDFGPVQRALSLVLCSIIVVTITYRVSRKPLMTGSAILPLSQTSHFGRPTLIALDADEWPTEVRFAVYRPYHHFRIFHCLAEQLVCDVAPASSDIETVDSRRYLIAPACAMASIEPPYVLHWQIYTRRAGRDSHRDVEQPAGANLAEFRRLGPCADSVHE